jgi:hypothetical protein
MVMENVGDVLKIKCKDIGVKNKEVVWRLNWGKIKRKCYVKSVGGVGKLKCNEIKEYEKGE